MKAINTHITLFMVLMISFVGMSQDYEIEWSELQPKEGSLIYLLPNSKDEFYALRWTGGRLMGHYKVTRHQNMQAESSAKIKLTAEAGIANFEGARVFGGQFVTFLSDKLDGKDNLYLQAYDEDCERDGPVRLLASYDLDRKRGKGSFKTRTSANGKYLGVVWEVAGKKENGHLYGFKVYDEEFNLVNEGEYPLPFDSKLSTIHEHHISNEGDYFLCLTEYEESEERRLFRKTTDFKALHIYHINEDEGLQDFVLDLDGRRVVAMAMSSDKDGLFTITGLYGEKDVPGVSGIFSRKMDLMSGETVNEGFRKFDDDFITQDWSPRAKRRIERQQQRGTSEPSLYNYRMRDVTFLEDGSILGTMEQYYVQVRTNPDARAGQASNMYYYYYNDIIAYKIDTVGEFSWVEKIRKYQVSVNDGGPYSSYESFVDDGKAYFIFNDNSKNYDTSGVYLNLDRIHTANYGKRRNAVALAELDLETGQINRKTFFDRSETNTLAVPKLFDVNYRTGEMIIYSISGRREKVGKLKFD